MLEDSDLLLAGEKGSVRQSEAGSVLKVLNSSLLRMNGLMQDLKSEQQISLQLQDQLKKVLTLIEDHEAGCPE